MKNNLEISSTASSVIKIDLKDFVDENYGVYANYVNMSRALVFADGLLPVQRRLLYWLYQNKIHHSGPFEKASAIAGPVSGELHPHGDASIAESLKNMAQPFKMRCPLIDYSGDVGKFTGDEGAAPRYWEARLSKYAMELLKDLENNSAEYKPTFDGRREEPITLPISFPNGLINGTQGVGVGYASKIPSHNPREIIEAVIKVLKEPNTTVDEICSIIKGPDFSTGGVLLEEDVNEYLKTGDGTVTIQGKYNVIKAEKGKHIIDFYELPYETSADSIKTALLEEKKAGNLPEMLLVEDYSGRTGLSFQIHIKAGVHPEQFMKKILKIKKAGLNKKYAVNMTVIHEGKPQKVNILTLLQQFIDFRKDCTVRGLTNKIENLQEILNRTEGLLKIISNLDEVVDLIKDSDSSSTAKASLIKIYKLSEEQAEYILSLPLRRITKADRLELEKTFKDNVAKKEEFENIINNEHLLVDYIEAQLRTTLKVIDSPRLTSILKENKKRDNLSKEIIKHEQRNGGTTICWNSDNTITKSYETKFTSVNHPYKQQIKIKALDNFLVITENGKAHSIPANYVSLDESIDFSMLDVQDKVVGITPIETYSANFGILLVTDKGNVNIVSQNGLKTESHQIVKLNKDERLISAIPLSNKHIKNANRLLLVSNSGMATMFALDEIRQTSSGAGTIKGMIVDNGTVVSANIVSTVSKEVLATISNQTVKLTAIKSIPERKRGTKGVIVHSLKNLEILKGSVVERLENIGLFNKKKKVELPNISDRAKSGDSMNTSDFVLGILDSTREDE